jgi:rhamnulokinase
MENKSRLKVLAFDLGASSGRAIVGSLDKEKKLILDEVYRFPNGGIQKDDSLLWDISKLFQEIKNGLLEYSNKYGSNLSSIGINTWGVDFILLNENDELLEPVYHYRDKRTIGMLEEMFKVVPKEEIFNQTGIQFMELNASTQIFSMVCTNSPRLKVAKTFIMLPDYFNFLLSGIIVSEFSVATTSQLYNPVEKDWANDLIKKLGLQPEWFRKIVPGGTVLGSIENSISEETGLNKNTKIIAPLTHDTGSAYAAVPVDMDKFKEGEYGIISSGTWSLLGVELREPLINEKALKYNYTNEGGINGTIRFLKNISGMWLIQECKKIWEKEGLKLTWNDIEEEAQKEKKFQYFINPDSRVFLTPSNMIHAIKNECKTTGQESPQTIGQISRTILESLAFRYKQTIENLEDIIQKKIKVIHIIGGGSQNDLLNQITANILGIPVIAGPAEATAIGNILVQALALKRIKDFSELRRIVRKSFPIKDYTPKDTEKWEEAYQVYLEKTKQSIPIF